MKKETRRKQEEKRKWLKDPQRERRLSSISERSVSFDESAGGISEAKDEEVNEYEDSEADGYGLGDDLDASDEARVPAGCSGAPRPITRNLAAQLWNVRHRVEDASHGSTEGRCRPFTDPVTPNTQEERTWKESDDDGVFGVKTEGTPYFQDSHMVPPRSSNRADRLARDTEASNAQRGDARASSGRLRRCFVPRDASTDNDCGEDDYYRKEDAEDDDPSDELARQVREVSEMERLKSTPRLGLATHRPLAQIKAFSGLRLERRMCHLRVKDIHELEDIINDIPKSEARNSTRETSAYLSRGRDRSHGCDERRAETSRDGYRRDRHDRHGRGYDRRIDDSRHTNRISLAEAPLSEMMAELQVRESKYGRSERSKSEDMRWSLKDSSSEDVKDRSTGDVNREAITLTRTTLTSMIVTSRPPTTLNTELRQSGRTAGLRTAAVAETFLTEGSTATPATKALTDVVGSMDRVQHAGELTIPPTTVSSVPALQRRFKLGSPPTETGLVPIGPPLASPPVDAESVYAFVGESKWLKTQPREEVNEVSTTGIVKERNGSFVGGESDERRNDELNGGSSECLVSSVTKKTGMTTNPRILSANAATSEQRNSWVMRSEDEGINTEGSGVSTRPPTTSASDEHLGPPSHVPGASTSLAVGSQRGPTEDGGGSEVTQLKLEGAYLAAATVSEDWGDRDAVSVSEHPGNDIEFEGYARELAFLPDLTEAESTTLDYTGPHV
ncbi:unnamed protein product [Phytophthora fragariaefolia]|uniref:Unnamed protein product n=1 Tax=Phytophthora fragariaefolia TaxID=1490495 RepID=A0A9W6XX81_9STRA|nr:unnamed protein product [Phytophthora fragariaefolia]